MDSAVGVGQVPISAAFLSDGKHPGRPSGTRGPVRSAQSPVKLSADLAKMAVAGSPRFGSLSLHSFFSRHSPRHSPHPHRVTHIRGLNDSPVCMVNDDWYGSTPLQPHPFIRSQVPAANGPSAAQPFGPPGSAASRPAGLSDAWREELQELAARVSQSAPAKTVPRDKQDEAVSNRQTQYSAQTGRIIPSSARTPGHRARRQDHRVAGQRPLGGQELRVLELLSQILQTDSLCLLQHWLLLADHREKDLVMGLLQQAMTDSVGPTHTLGSGQSQPLPTSVLLLTPPVHQPQLRRRVMRSYSPNNRPERIGEAEVLQLPSDQNLGFSETSPDQAQNAQKVQNGQAEDA